MEAVLYTLRRVLLLLNTVGSTVAFIWLMILGVFWPVGYAVAAFFAPVALLFLLLPAAVLAAPALGFIDRKKPARAFALLLLARLYEWLILSGWFIGVMYFMLARADYHNYWALLVWSYGLTLAPWLYISEKIRARETVGDSTRVTLFANHVAYLSVALCGLVAKFPPLALMEVYGGMGLTGAVAGTGIAIYKMRKVV